MKLIHLSHERSAAIFVLVCILAATGLVLALRLPSSIFPSVTFPRIKVIASVGDEPAARMMPTATRPLEEALLRVPGIQRVLSTTSRGSSELSAEFFWGTDMQVALQRAQAEVQRIRPDLPPQTRIDIEWMNTAIFPILGYALVSDTRSQADLWDLAQYTLKPELVRIAGVSQVQVQGGRNREFQVRLNAGALAARRLSAADVVSAIRKNNLIGSVGLTESNHELYLALVNGRTDTTAALSRLAVPVAGGGVPAQLSDLGTVSAEDAVSYVRTTANGHAAVLVNIVRQPEASTLAIARGVDELFRSKPGLIPKDVRWQTFYDQAEYVRHSVNGVRDAIVIGVVLAGLVLLAFLRNWRVTLIAVAAIPISVALVFLGLTAWGQTVNLMTLGGIAAALGLVADDAIVVVESISRRREEGDGEPAKSGVIEIFPALLGSSLSTIVIFLPFAFLTGVVGAFFKPLALTMALSLVVSFLLAAFAVPIAVRKVGFRGPPPPREATPERPSRFERAARFLIRRPVIALACVVLLVAGAYLLNRSIGTDFLPTMDEGSIILDYSTPPGTSLTDTDAMLQAAEKVILAIPDIQSYSRRTGTQLGFFITEPNRGDYVLKLKPRASRRPVDAIVEELRTRIAAMEPAIRTDFGQLLGDNIGDLTGGVPQPIDVKIFGEDHALLQEKARTAAGIIRKILGVTDVFDGIVIAGPALDIRVKPAEAARYGLTAEDIQAAVEPALTGTVSGDLRVGEKLYDLRVFARQDGNLQAIKIRAGSGALLPLATVATITTGSPEAEINRDNLKTYVGVTARLAGRDLGGAIAEIRKKLSANLALPPGMSLEYGGQYAEQQSSFQGLLGVLFAGLLLVSIVLLFEFGDWRAPLLTSLLSLAVLAGAFGALVLTGMTLNIASFVGAIMMVGILGENAIFVIHEARQELRRGRSVEDAWAIAARRRLRPVAMTILATAFALAPLAFALGEGSQLQQPLAIAVIGGFVLSGPLVLLALPALYAWLDPKARLAGVVEIAGSPAV